MRNKNRFKAVHNKRNGGLIYDGKNPILAYWFVYWARLGNMTECNIWFCDSEGKPEHDLYCDFGGIVRDVMSYLNHGVITEKHNYIYSIYPEVIGALDKIRNAKPEPTRAEGER